MASGDWGGAAGSPSSRVMPLWMSSLYLLRTRHQAYSNCVLLDTEPAACSDLNFLSNFCPQKRKEAD